MLCGGVVFFFIYLLIKKEYKFFKNVVLGFILGFIIANIPMLVYCFINNSFKETFFWSIYLNFNYVNNFNLSFLHRFYKTVTEITYLPIYIIIHIGSIYLLFQKIDIRLKMVYAISYVFSFYVVVVSYVGFNFFHYNVYMLPYMIPFFIMIFKIVEKYEIIYNKKMFRSAIYVFILLFIIFVNKILGRTKPTLNEMEQNVIDNLQKDYNNNNNLKI